MKTRHSCYINLPERDKWSLSIDITWAVNIVIHKPGCVLYDHVKFNQSNVYRLCYKVSIAFVQETEIGKYIHVP